MVVLLKVKGIAQHFGTDTELGVSRQNRPVSTQCKILEMRMEQLLFEPPRLTVTHDTPHYVGLQNVQDSLYSIGAYF